MPIITADFSRTCTTPVAMTIPVEPTADTAATETPAAFIYQLRFVIFVLTELNINEKKKTSEKIQVWCFYSD